MRLYGCIQVSQTPTYIALLRFLLTHPFLLFVLLLNKLFDFVHIAYRRKLVVLCELAKPFLLGDLVATSFQPFDFFLCEARH